MLSFFFCTSFSPRVEFFKLSLQTGASFTSYFLVMSSCEYCYCSSNCLICTHTSVPMAATTNIFIAFSFYAQNFQIIIPFAGPKRQNISKKSYTTTYCDNSLGYIFQFLSPAFPLHALESNNFFHMSSTLFLIHEISL